MGSTMPFSHLYYPSIVPPQVMPFVFGDEPSNYGDSTAVQCMVFKGDTPLQLHWTLNGQPITNEHVGIRIIKMSPKLSSLSIDSISGHHRGLFKCIATNAAGMAEQSAELMVNGYYLRFNQDFCIFFVYF